MQFRSIDKISIIGRSGCGKSYLGRQIQSIYPRIFIFDSLDEYPRSEKDLNNFNEFAEFIEEADNYKKFVRVIRFSIDEKNHQEIFEMMMRCLYELGDCLIVIEECQDYCTPHKIGHYFKKSLTSGRHRGLSFIFTTQRPALINNTVLSQSTHVFVGNLIDKNDSDTMAKLMRKKSDEFSLLKDREFFWFCPARDPHTIKINTNTDQLPSKKK